MPGRLRCRAGTPAGAASSLESSGATNPDPATSMGFRSTAASCRTAAERRAGDDETRPKGSEFVLGHVAAGSVRETGAAPVAPQPLVIARQLTQPVPPHRTSEIEFQMAAPVGGLDQRRTLTERGVGERTPSGAVQKRIV